MPPSYLDIGMGGYFEGFWGREGSAWRDPQRVMFLQGDDSRTNNSWTKRLLSVSNGVYCFVCCS